MASKKPKPEGLFPPDFWSRPVARDKGDTDGFAIFAAVGAALTAWEMAEEALAHLCLIFSETTDVKGAMAVQRLFGSIESSSGRRAALEKLSVVYFSPHQDDPLIKTPFNQLMTAFSSASNLRDDIAHGKNVHLDIDNRDMGCFLLPSDYNSARNNPFFPSSDVDSLPLRGKYRYTAQDVNDVRAKFGRLRDAIYDYSQAIVKKDGLLPAIREKLSMEPPPKT